MEYKNAFDFPHRMNVSTNASMEFTALDYRYIDFKTGLPVPNYTAPAAVDMYAALQRYLTVLETYEDIVLPGFFNFPEPASIPEDLLLPFGEFAHKHNITAAVPQIWDSTAMGLGHTMDVPTLFVVQASGIPMVRALLGIGAAAVPASGRLFDLYEGFAKFLGADVLYSSTVVSADRDRDGVSLQVRDDDGRITCIVAKRLLIAFEPTPESMKPFRPDVAENRVFSKIGFTTVYAGVLQHPSLERSTAYSNRLPGSLNYTAFPTEAQVGRIDYIGGTEDLFQFTAVGTATDTAESMRALITRVIDGMVAAGTLPASNGSVGFPVFANHGRMHARVTADDLRGGFIQTLLALQGRRSTWYTGAAFSAGFSTVLWEYNDVLLTSMVAGM